MADQPVMLIVDDIEMNRVVLSQFFQDDYHIEMAENGREAWEMILHTPVQIVLLDLVMPVMDGYALLTQLKQDERTAGIPVIVMTGNSERDSEAQAMEMGAADFITKPYNPTVVRYRVRNVMARQENEWRKLEQAAQGRQLQQVNRDVELDQLTGLYNREAFYRRASRLMQERADTSYMIIYLDVSCFKVINDLFRMETGNLILQTAAYYFKASVGDKGVVGRLEADHFALCVPQGADGILHGGARQHAQLAGHQPPYRLLCGHLPCGGRLPAHRPDVRPGAHGAGPGARQLYRALRLLR